MRVFLEREGLLDPSLLRAWTAEKRAALLASMRAGMRRVAPDVKAAMQAEARRAFRVRSSKFVSAWGARVYDARRSEPPMMLAGALKVPWVEVFERGGVITPRRGRGLLIPLLRIGRKRFARLIADLIRAGNAAFVNVHGRVIVFAENIPETRSATARFARAARRRLGGGRIKEVPIAVLVPRVALSRRTRIRAVAQSALPAIARAIESSTRLG